MEEFEINEEIILQEEDSEIREAPVGKGVLHETKESTERRGILVAVYKKGEEEQAECSLDELERLFDTAEGTAVARLTQGRDKPDGRTCIGKGKLLELLELCRTLEAEVVIFDCELSPMQIREIENDLENTVSVIDRSMLILDIFAAHATTAEGRLQVELAQLKYTSPRLIGKGLVLSRLGGGVGTRGPGETKLEIDRRRLKARIHSLESELERLEAVRETMRRSRERSGIVKCAVVGYTNAGKSTLLNRLTDAGILAEDKLFATLDPTTRQLELPGGSKVLLTDTVGFINKLPHHLIKAFKSTLDEAVWADVLIIVADASDSQLQAQMDVTYSTLTELGAMGKPTIVLFNKCDRVANEETLLSLRALASESDTVCCFASALTGDGIDEFLASLEAITQSGKKRVTMYLPFDKSGVLNTAYKIMEEVEAQYTDSAIIVTALADAKSAGQLCEYIKDYEKLFLKAED